MSVPKKQTGLMASTTRIKAMNNQEAAFHLREVAPWTYSHIEISIQKGFLAEEIWRIFRRNIKSNPASLLLISKAIKYMEMENASKENKEKVH